MVSTASEITSGNDFIIATDLSLHHPLFSAYSNVNLAISKGVVCSIVGENGSGKTELLLTLAGRMKQTEGTLWVANYENPQERSKIRKLSGLGFFEKVNEVQPVLSVRSVVAAELNLHSVRSSRKATESFLEKWGLIDVARSHVESLDRFTYDRLGIALGMVGKPQLLVIDDIEADLTRHQSIKLLNELHDIAHTEGTTVVVSITDYDLARLADCVVPINEAARKQAQTVESKLEQERMLAQSKSGDAVNTNVQLNSDTNSQIPEVALDNNHLAVENAPTGNEVTEHE